MGWIIAGLVVLYFLFRPGSNVSLGTLFVPAHPSSFSNANVDNPSPPWGGGAAPTVAASSCSGSSCGGAVMATPISAPAGIAPIAPPSLGPVSAAPAQRTVAPVAPIRTVNEVYGAKTASIYKLFGGRAPNVY